MNEFARLFGRAVQVAKRYLPKRKLFVYYPDKKENLIILDDVFPNPLSDWRLNEHAHYLENVPGTVVYTGTAKLWNAWSPKKYYKEREQFLQSHDQIKPDQLRLLKPKANINTKLAYCLFYWNITNLFPYFEKYKIPFAFTLYPGGGFQIYHSASEQKLKAIFASSYFKHVFVNMPFVYNYLIEELNVPANKVTLIFSVPLKFNEELLKADLPLSKPKGPLKVGFVAHKYFEYGLDKGFDVFCKVAKAFDKNPDFKFAVIGNFSEKDRSVSTNNIDFLGSMLPEEMNSELKSFDVVLSPNRSYVSQRGAFDGFPTSSVVHASIAGALMMASDSMDNAPLLGLRDYEDLILVSDRPSEICEKLLWVQQHPKESIEIARKGRKKLMELCHFENQLEVRLAVIKDLVNLGNTG